jgi:hypothetical protein
MDFSLLDWTLQHHAIPPNIVREGIIVLESHLGPSSPRPSGQYALPDIPLDRENPRLYEDGLPLFNYPINYSLDGSCNLEGAYNRFQCQQFSHWSSSAKVLFLDGSGNGLTNRGDFASYLDLDVVDNILLDRD